VDLFKADLCPLTTLMQNDQMRLLKYLPGVPANKNKNQKLGLLQFTRIFYDNMILALDGGCLFDSRLTVADRGISMWAKELDCHDTEKLRKP